MKSSCYSTFSRDNIGDIIGNSTNRYFIIDFDRIILFVFGNKKMIYSFSTNRFGGDTSIGFFW